MVRQLPLRRSPKKRKLPRSVLKRRLISSTVAFGLIVFLLTWCGGREERPLPDPTTGLYGTVPLVMKGGDPYIRALMRTISASESNVPKPYAVIYGGQYISDFSRHPERCITIVSGPNAGKCSTAAGRYQFIKPTWKKLVPRYHPKPSEFLLWKTYSFEPEYQDQVVYAWLNDSQVWGVNISELLRQGKVHRVLRLLSSTWTSLGYGIETNSMSGSLPDIYQLVLWDELQKAEQVGDQSKARPLRGETGNKYFDFLVPAKVSYLPLPIHHPNG